MDKLMGMDYEIVILSECNIIYIESLELLEQFEII